MKHEPPKWLLTYIERWLKAPIEHEDDIKQFRTRVHHKAGDLTITVESVSTLHV